MLTLQIVFALLLGLAFGSFLNVCISRLPRHESVVRPASHCPHCKSPIATYDNVPLVSYVLLRGRCRNCRKRISWRYPVVEAGVALLAIANIVASGVDFWSIAFAIFCALLLALAVCDLETMQLPDALTLSLLLLGILGWFIGRVYRRRLLLRQLVKARLEPEELKAQLDAGEPVYIVDLRHPLELVPDPYTLPGAIHVSPDALAARVHEIPRDRDVVLYCTCPSEATAAKTAMTLHKLGIERVRPLRGGYDEWKRLGYPLDAIEPFMPEQPLVQVAGAN